jgi:hypothetical protein
MRKSHMVPPTLHKRGQAVKHAGKGAVEEHLPSRHAMATLTKGDPMQRTMNNYAKATPMAAPDMTGLNIME